MAHGSKEGPPMLAPGPTYDAQPLEKVHTYNDYNVFANKTQHSEQPESINDRYLVENTDRNVTPDTSNMCDNEGKANQNVNEPENERVMLASVIANLKLDVDENKIKHKQLKKANTSLSQELEKSKQNLFFCKDCPMHNNIIAADSKDRLPMLATRRYAQWQSHFIRYVDTKQMEKEAIHLLLTRIRDKIYLTIDAAHNMWIAIKRLQHEPYYQAAKSHKSYAPPLKQSSSTKSHATTRHKGKEIAKPITPLSKSAFEEDSDPEQAQRDKDMQKNLALIAKYFKNLYKPTNNNLRTS
nr:hypothetical protein [Tanacetum cinerariifolium]